MNKRPAYFEHIRQRAERRWEQLEQDPDLAGPWHQLFRQVQSPRHVLSELLQNADDAGATEASARIKDQVFIFEHNGEDFTEEHLESLCHFGYSNKRTLHTIGFRGIGFKSTFSLGDRVNLFTPSLSISFHRRRFTEPEWIEPLPVADERTHIHVKISDWRRQQEVEKNLEEWFKSPVSLLFFKNIRCIQIEDRKVSWDDPRPGPVPESRWLALRGKTEPVLLIRSEVEEFPEDALDDIRRERMLGIEEEMEFPPCEVEIVLGAKGRLYAVLPTGVETGLPFACNAPFIQNPDRFKIKDPAMSPTNRWLLERIGNLAASAMFHWLGREKTSLAERSHAYSLFPDANQFEYPLDGAYGNIVKKAFARSIDGQDILLTENGQLVPKKQSIIVPPLALDVWTPDQAAALLDVRRRPALCRSVGEAERDKLLQWGVIDEINQQGLLDTLLQKHLPKPETWRQLLALWAYVAPALTSYPYRTRAGDFKIVPVQGKDALHAASEVVRLGEKKLLQSKDDWEFLAKHLLVLNQNWPRFLAEQRRAISEQTDPAEAHHGLLWGAHEQRRAAPEQAGHPTRDEVEGAYTVLKKIGLDDTSDASKAINQAANGLFHNGSAAQLTDCVWLAQIAAKLGASVDDRFLYVTEDMHFRSNHNDTILFDEDGELKDLLPEARRESQLLHKDYSENFTSCSQDDWKKWIMSGRARIRTFIPLTQKRTAYHSKNKIEREIQRRGFYDDLSYPYVTSHFILEDWDFEEDHWCHWKTLATDDKDLWVKIAKLVLAQQETYWSNARNARLLQVSTAGSEKAMTADQILPLWVLQLRDLPCLPDKHGIPRRSVDLLRRTPETESLMDVELFIDGRLDLEATRPLLDLLGVQDTPTGPDRLLDCLRALARAEEPPVREVEKWYRCLDQMIDACSTADHQKIRQALRSEKLVLTHDGAWTTASTVFISSNEEDVPGAAVIRHSVSELTLWSKIGVGERPTADLAVKWLKSLTAGATLPPDDVRRVQALLGRHPARIWKECGHWLNLSGEWAPADTLPYALTEQARIPWQNLYPWVQKKTADLRGLSTEEVNSKPFLKLDSLTECIENRLQKDPRSVSQLMKGDWLRALGNGLRHVKIDSEKDADRIHALADRLARTEWWETSELEIIPYINGTPAGTPRQVDVVWQDREIYVRQLLSNAKLARLVPEEIGRIFAQPSIQASLYYSFERSAPDVQAYLEANFSLSTAADLPAKGNTQGTKGKPDPKGETVPTESGGRKPEKPPDESKGEPIIDDGRNLRHHRVKPHKESIMERFAKAQGFQKDCEEWFSREDGSIHRTTGTRFPWERCDANGNLICYYWPIDRCLVLEPLQIDVDVWDLIVKHPDTHALVLRDTEDRPEEFNGSRLVAMCKKEQVTIHPAAYRLKYNEQY